MSNKKIEVKVVADGYIDICTSDNPLLCSQIIGLIAADQKQNPKSAEEILMDQLQEQAEKAESAKNNAEYYRRKSDEKVEKLQKEIEAMKEKAAGLFDGPEDNEVL